MAEKKEVSFEENLNELEDIVKKLENGDISLDNAIKEYDKAMNLANLCDKKLKEAESKLSKIVNESNELEDFEIEN